MLNSHRTSKMRIEALVKHLSEPEIITNLREFDYSIGESTNSLSVEKNRLMIISLSDRCMTRNIMTNMIKKSQPLFFEMSAIVKKFIVLKRFAFSFINQLGIRNTTFMTVDDNQQAHYGLIDFVLMGMRYKNRRNKLNILIDEKIPIEIHTLIVTKPVCQVL